MTQVANKSYPLKENIEEFLIGTKHRRFHDTFISLKVGLIIWKT